MTDNYKGVTLDELRSELRYVPSSGKLYWKKPGQGRVAGKPVGTKSATGYLRITWAKGVSLAIHRIIFWMEKGYLPEVVDHANRNRLDNRIDNLRDATHSQNRVNAKMPSSNTSGYRWVKFDKSWCYIFRVAGVRYARYGFNSAEDAYHAACIAHREAAKEFSPVRK